MKQPLRYFQEVRIELARVHWPKRDDVIRLTALVVTISLIVAAYVGGLDYLFTKLLEAIVQR